MMIFTRNIFGTFYLVEMYLGVSFCKNQTVDETMFEIIRRLYMAIWLFVPLKQVFISV